MRFHADVERLVTHDNKVKMVVVTVVVLSYEIKRAAVGVGNVHSFAENNFTQAIDVFFRRNFLRGVQQAAIQIDGHVWMDVCAGHGRYRERQSG